MLSHVCAEYWFLPSWRDVLIFCRCDFQVATVHILESQPHPLPLMPINTAPNLALNSFTLFQRFLNAATSFGLDDSLASAEEAGARLAQKSV
jgi:hypothetical protein